MTRSTAAASHQLYLDVLTMIEGLARDDPEPDTPEGRMLKELSRIVETYEIARFKFLSDLAAQRKTSTRP